MGFGDRTTIQLLVISIRFTVILHRNILVNSGSDGYIVIVIELYSKEVWSNLLTKMAHLR